METTKPQKVNGPSPVQSSLEKVIATIVRINECLSISSLEMGIEKVPAQSKVDEIINALDMLNIELQRIEEVVSKI